MVSSKRGSRDVAGNSTLEKRDMPRIISTTAIGIA